MGEMPKLTNEDPWQLQAAFAQEMLRNQLLEARYAKYNPSGTTDSSTPSSQPSNPTAIPPSDADPASEPTPSGPANLQPLLSAAAKANGVNLPMFSRLVGTESSFNPNAVSPKGAVGLGQLMPGTAADMGVKDSKDPAQNLQGSAKYLNQMTQKYNGNPALAAAAYNWGSGNVDKWIASGADPSKMPSSVRAYAKKVSGQDVHAQADDDSTQSDQVADSDAADPTSRLSWLA